MTIQEAVKSGKRFKRPSWPDSWYIYVRVDGRLVEDPIGEPTSVILAEDILAIDWELKP